ncbi:hypothetical protein G7Z17_g1963 [Cylindrodendrum hubeiense]|uniref:Peptidase M20 dimerisation domain-containing protein n=1 Tax=Cylindrodendrum hubeiense TaxID=595255 RepID=A0A9P5HHD6_9HYPO|nr:hypothetical protein G7Z17_g1963 [Cylindrodendrum hubeiense]
MSLHDLDAQYDMQTNNRLLAHQHFTSGASMFKKTVSNQGDDLEILSCFYYIYIYMSRQTLVDRFKLQKLSQKTLDYIGKFDLETLANIIDQTTQIAPNAAIRSFICRLILWLYKEDVYCAFSGCAGDVARYFQAKPKLLKAVWEVSRPILQLNWGPDYPESQCVNDLEMAHIVDMTIELLSLRFDVTEMIQLGSMSPTVLQAMEAKFSLIETKFFIVFGIATSPTAPSTEMVTFAAAAVAIYHAIRLFCYRHTENFPEEARNIAVKQCLAQLLTVAQKATSSVYSPVMFDGLQWALFIGGIETNDSIHLDWIMNKLAIPRFKSAIRTIREVETQSGKVGMHTISTILRGTFADPTSTASQASGQVNGNEAAEHESIFKAISNVGQELRALNTVLCYKEFKAHDNITSFLRAQGLDVVSHAYGLETSFLAEYGNGGRLVVFCAEYDALEGMGHACGHNLIATSSIAAFLGVVGELKRTKALGRVRLLGCPAEEGGGGKIKLIKAGAFKDVDAALMLHPIPPVNNSSSPDGVAYGTCLAGYRFKAIFKGKAAHAGSMPWLGNNALDAATLTYNAVSMLRQQVTPTDRINIIIREGGLSSNIITDKTTIQAMEPYADLRPNEALCSTFTEVMSTNFNKEYYCDLKNKDLGGYGTDMGNVSYECPSFHGNFCIPVLPGDTIHAPGFANAAGTTAAHQTAIQAAKGVSVTGLRVLIDDAFAQQVKKCFDLDKELR